MALSDFVKKVIYGDDPVDEYDENDNSGYGEDYGYEDEVKEQPVQQARAPRTPAPERQESVGSYGMSAPQQTQNVNMTSGTAIEMRVVKPDTLDSVTQIADSLLDRKTILLNLEDTSKETARRLIDFLNGVAYAINGNLKKVASNTYVVTPNNVEVSGEQIRETQDKNDIV